VARSAAIDWRNFCPPDRGCGGNPRPPGRWLYLAAILDLYSRKIVGWAMSQHIDTALVLKALAMALPHRRPPAQLLFHTDRGVQYASGDYRQAIGAAGLLASMSRKGNCYDNAAMESFWSTLKMELVYRCHFDTRRQARRLGLRLRLEGNCVV
jgi:transposase InsO family protein